MADKRILFELDEAQLLAKLHLGGCERQKDAQYFNTGVVGMKSGATPTDLKGVSFDTSAGTYELGVLMPAFKVKLKKTPADFLAEPDEKGEDGKEKGALDKSERPKTVALADLLGDEENAKALDEAVEAQRKLALESYIAPYVEAFAGKKAVAALKEADLVRICLSEKNLDAESFDRYPDFKIPAWGDAEKKAFDAALQAEFDKDPKKSEIEYSNVCFKIGYSIEPLE